MSHDRRGFWSLFAEFAPSGPGAQRVRFDATAGDIATFVSTHPAWDHQVPVRAETVEDLLLNAPNHDPGFPWNVSKTNGRLYFTPR